MLRCVASGAKVDTFGANVIIIAQKIVAKSISSVELQEFKEAQETVESKDGHEQKDAMSKTEWRAAPVL